MSKSCNDDIGVVIMAGGRGERLKPLTNNTPKPLLKIDESPLLLHILKYFKKYNFPCTTVSICYKNDVFLQTIQQDDFKDFSIDCMVETEPLGSFGALSKFKCHPKKNFLVYNADILTNLNLHAFIKTFQDKQPDLMIASRYYSLHIPFGVMQTDEHRYVTGITEKPNYSFFFNAGIYLVKTEILSLIPDHHFFDIIDLIHAMKKANKTIMSYPILDYWMDIGTLEDFHRVQKDIEILNM